VLPGLNAAAHTPSTHEPIAIIGIGCRLPGGANSAQAFWQLLRDGRSAISEIPAERWDLAGHYDSDPQRPLFQHVRSGGFVDGIDQFDAAFFGISPREAVCMDPQQRLLMEVAWQAIEDAGQPLEAIRGQRVGVFMGISSSDYSSLLWASPEGYLTPDNEPFVLPGNTGCIAANRLSYFFDLKGPSFTVDTACSSSLVAVHLACESIWRGESNAALAGGVQALIHPGIQGCFCKAGLLAPDGRCKSFDAAADGYVRSEGAGAVLLKLLSAAQADGDPIVALIHGTAVNSDGRSNGMVAPNLRAQVACVRAAFESAGIDPAATQYVEAHGTGTRQGDPIELRALGTVLGEGRAEDQPCRVGSVKTNLGHSETAAGITGLIKAALCVQHRQLPPSLNFRTPNPAIDFSGLKLKVQTELEPFPKADEPAVVGVSSFGFGGTNAHVVLSDAPKPPPPPRYGQRMPQQLLALSARTDDALRQQAAQLAALLRAKPNLSLTDLCATANERRSHFVRRQVCLGADRAALLNQLEACASGGSAAAEAVGAVTGQASRRPGKLAFLFTGQGSQALGMARGLHEQHPVFREAFDRATGLLDPLLEQPLATVLFPAEGAEEQAATLLNQTGFTQPALFVVGYALAQLWKSWGLRPDLLIGHSVGEIVAAHLAGVFSLEDAVKLVAARGRLMQALPKGGGMVALIAPAQQVSDLIATQKSLAIAAYNGPTNTVVSGPQKALDSLVQVAQNAGIACHPLAVSHAFHSPAMAPMLEAFEQELRQIRFSPPSRPLVSNVTGELAGPEIAQSDYWCDHVLSPVRFAQGMATLAAQGAVTFVELGAKPTLIGMGRQCLEGPFAWWPSLRPGQDDWQVILRSLAELHRSGYGIDWKGFHRPFPHRFLPLPGYPFQRQRFWWQRPGEGEGAGSLWLDHIFAGSARQAARAGLVQPQAAARQATPAQEAWSGLQPLELPGGGEQRFATTLSSACPADLDDHRIRRQVVFPAAGFVQLALQAAAAQALPLALAELSLDQPLKLAAEATALQLVWTARGIEFHSRQAGPDASWRSHGSCEAAAQGAGAEITPLLVPAEAEALDLSGFYAALAAFGLSYGPAFRSLVSLQRQGDRAWATVRRQHDAQDWALLDGCFQAVAATLDPDAAAGQLFLPVGFEAIHLQQLPLPDQLHCQVQLRPSDEPAFVLADLLLLPSGDQGDGTGPAAQPEPLGWIRGFRLRRLPRAALDWLFPLEAADASGAASLHEPGPGDWLVRAEWEAIPAGDLTAEAAASTTPPKDLVRASALGPEPVAAVTALLQRAQQAPAQDSAAGAASPAPVWLLLDTPEHPALSGALDGFAKAAALEQGQRQWLRLHLLDGADAASLPWSQIQALAPTELALAWDGRQLLRQRLRPLPPERFRFATRSFGLLESLEPQPIAAPQGPSDPAAPGPGELELAVEATGLNFRDVLNALGLLRAYSRQLGLDEAAQVPFGGECVGTVTAVGPGADPQLIGSRMLAALAVGSLASHVNTRVELCVPLPASLSPAEGASVSTAFLTAIYGLQTLAGLKTGETVLIHAAAGGVGQAAVQVALRAGARVLATASAPKQQALLDQGVEAVFDSRSLAFAEQVRAHTGGRGVDVVLNSLKGEWVDASFEALAEGGRFVELGKIEIWSRAEAASRRPDATYLPFDLLEVAAADPQLIRGLLEQLLADLEAGRYQLLPIQAFPISQTIEAFRLMAQARHVGKVVLTNPDALGSAATAAATRLQSLQDAPNSTAGDSSSATTPITPEASYLITGALGGLGLQLCQWLADQGARSLLLVARSAAHPSEQAQQVLSGLKERGVTCTLIPCDLGASGAAATQQAQILASALEAVEPGKPLRGVFHAAGVLDDGLIDTQTPERLAAVLAPKLGGWQLLEQALAKVGTKVNPLKTAARQAPAEQLGPEQQRPFVVHFSSMAALLGSPGQSNYCAANGALDALANSSRADRNSESHASQKSTIQESEVLQNASSLWGPQLSIQWGPWDGAGMAGALGERERQRFAALGVHLLPPDGAFEALGMLLRRGISGAVGVLDLDWPRLAEQGGARQAAALELMVAHAQTLAAARGSECAGIAETPAYLKVLEDTPPLERQAVLVGFVQQQLAKVMGLGDPQQIDPTEPLFNMGLDSLMALELTVLLEKNLGVRLTESLVFEHPTVDDLVRYFLRDVLFPEKEPISTLPHTTSGVSKPPNQGSDRTIHTTPSPTTAPTDWDQQVADVAAMDAADLLKQLRGE